MLADVAAAAGVPPAVPGLPMRVEVVRRVAGGRQWLFVLNHTDRAQAVPAEGTDLLTGAVLDGTLTVAPGAVAVVRQDSADPVHQR